MSFFDDDGEGDWYYDPEDEFQKQVLQNADANDDHPLAYLAMRMGAAIDCMEEFTEQDPHISKSERIAIRSDIEEARESIERATKVIPTEAVQE